MRFICIPASIRYTIPQRIDNRIREVTTSRRRGSHGCDLVPDPNEAYLRRDAGYAQKHDSAQFSSYEQRHKMCLSKVPYLTKNDAIYAAKHRQKHCRKDLRRYRCPYCGHIHLTSKSLEEYPKAD